MAQSLELRTIFADSTWATRNDDGSFSINLAEQMEVAPEHVLFLDNISVCGNLPQNLPAQPKPLCHGARAQAL